MELIIGGTGVHATWAEVVAEYILQLNAISDYQW